MTLYTRSILICTRNKYTIYLIIHIYKYAGQALDPGHVMTVMHYYHHQYRHYILLGYSGYAAAGGVIHR